MLDIKELERKWWRYHLKRRILPAALLLLASLSIISWLLFSAAAPQAQPEVHAKKEHTAVTTHAVTIKPVPAKPSSPPQKRTVATPTPKHPQHSIDTPHSSEKKEAIVLQPDTAFLQTIASEPLPPNKPTNKPAANSLPKPPVQPSKPPKTVPHKQSSVSLQKTLPKKTKSIIISTKKTNKTLEYLINRFHETRDPQLALYIAQSFFRKKAYQECIRWSVMANSINPSNEVSWILFAKAKTALGQKEEAIKALKIYLHQYPSHDAETFLKVLESQP